MVKKMRTNQMMMTKGILAQSLFKKHLKLLFGASEFAGNHITCKLLTVETKKILFCFCILLATIELNLRKKVMKTLTMAAPIQSYKFTFGERRPSGT